MSRCEGPRLRIAREDDLYKWEQDPFAGSEWFATPIAHAIVDRSYEKRGWTWEIRNIADQVLAESKRPIVSEAQAKLTSATPPLL